MFHCTINKSGTSGLPLNLGFAFNLEFRLRLLLSRFDKRNQSSLEVEKSRSIFKKSNSPSLISIIQLLLLLPITNLTSPQMINIIKSTIYHNNALDNKLQNYRIDIPQFQSLFHTFLLLSALTPRKIGRKSNTDLINASLLTYVFLVCVCPTNVSQLIPPPSYSLHSVIIMTWTTIFM